MEPFTGPAEHTPPGCGRHWSVRRRGLQARLVGQVSFGSMPPRGVTCRGDCGASPEHLQDHPVGRSGSGKIVEALHTAALDIGYVFGPITDTALIARRVDVVELVVAVPCGGHSRSPSR